MTKLLSFIFIAFLPLMYAADIYLVGDSTMCFYTEKYAPREGWGMRLQELCKPGVKVYNCAADGRSTKSFQNEGLWDNMLAKVKKGDFVVMGMGINDSAPKSTRPKNHTDLGGEFEGNLKRWVQNVRDKGGIPVLCTNTVIWTKEKSSTKNQTQQNYNQAILKTAEECGCEKVDLYNTAFDLLQAMEQENILPLYMSMKGDYCHLTDKGASFYAALFVKLCKDGKLAAASLFR